MALLSLTIFQICNESAMIPEKMWNAQKVCFMESIHAKFGKLSRLGNWHDSLNADNS